MVRVTIVEHREATTHMAPGPPFIDQSKHLLQLPLHSLTSKKEGVKLPFFGLPADEKSMLTCFQEQHEWTWMPETKISQE